MKAVIYHGPRNISVEDIAVPDINEDEVLVRVHACGICGSDMHMYRKGMLEALGRPVDGGYVMGHEFSGETVDVGKSVTRFKTGDRITGAGVGVFAEYVAVKIVEFNTHVLPDNIEYPEGATLEPLATSVQGVRLAQVNRNDTVVILGAGIIGLGCLQVIKATVPCRTIVIDSSAKRLDLAARLGADVIVDFKKEDPVEKVIELTGATEPPERFEIRGGNADVVIDCAGAKLSADQGLRMLKNKNGHLAMVALYEEHPKLDFNQVVRRQVNIHGSWSWAKEDWLKAIELVRCGDVDRKPMISHVYPLDEAPAAFAEQDNPDASIKVLFQIKKEIG